MSRRNPAQSLPCQGGDGRGRAGRRAPFQGPHVDASRAGRILLNAENGFLSPEAVQERQVGGGRRAGAVEEKKDSIRPGGLFPASPDSFSFDRRLPPAPGPPVSTRRKTVPPMRSRSLR